jgi:gluconate 2-dehydrogenase gamma chain
MSDEQPRIISRRALLRSAGIAGAAAAAAPASLIVSTTEPPSAAPAYAQAASLQSTTPARREAFENLTATEADLLDAVVDRLIPSDALGPGAREARVTHYIDRALGGALASSRQAYASGLASLDRYAQSSRGRRFLDLPNSDRDSVLIDVETGAATGFSGSSAQFFALVLGHTRQGMFGDPYYGGNANFVGWDLLGYPGVRTMVTPADQRAYEAGALAPNHRSAYDYDTFNKATAGNGAHTHEDSAHGD